MISIRKDFKSELKKSAEQLPALVKIETSKKPA